MRMGLLLMCLCLPLPAAGQGLDWDEDDPAERQELILDLLRRVTDPAESARRKGPDRLDHTRSERDRRAALEIRRTLRRHRLDIDLDDRPLLEAFDLFRQMSGLNLVVSKPAREQIEAAGARVTLHLRDIPLENLLNLMIETSGAPVVYGCEFTVLTIAAPEEFPPLKQLGFYPIGDLIQAPPDFPAPRLGLGELTPGDD